MNQVLALERIENPNTVRKSGYTPAVVYGKGIENPQKIKILKKDLLKLLRNNSKHSKVYLDYNNSRYFCIIKDIQFDYLNKDILHVEFQAVHEDEEVKVSVPLVYEGEQLLESKGFILEVYVSEVELEGKLKDLPDVIKIDVKDKKLGDKITVEDLKLKEGIKVLDDKDKVLAVISEAETSEEELAS
ncbi:large subunit ribosomal protein L25 [Caloramator fervidus]|uniref:Large ribosomal subunit protein bL25 n=1 Tax=Caloramator fervidus TaxID=29344 RepID=A0A1H5WI12_9CLOT|nr:50S ribosomal protein L25 [Caloramator fervidus]SEF98940.1 large subunit ribosomal protein L25 [Caloramator fervidus]